MTPLPRARRPSHRTHLAHRAWIWQPRRAAAIERSLPEVVELGEGDAKLDGDGAIWLSLRGLLKVMVASRPETLSEHGRARCIRLREIAAGTEALGEIGGPALLRSDLVETLIAHLGGEALRAAHDAGDGPFLTYLDHALAQRLG